MKVLNTVVEARCGANEVAYGLKDYLGRSGLDVDMLTQRFKSEHCSLNGGEFTPIDDLAKSLQDYDIVHVHTPLAADKVNDTYIIDKILEASENPKLVYHLHLLEYDLLRRLGVQDKEIKNDYHVKAQEEMMGLSDIIVHPSEWQRKATEELYPEFSGKYEVVPNGSDFYKYGNDPEVNEIAQSLSSTLGNNKRKTVLYIGRVTPVKGVIELAKACKTLENGRKINLVYIGPCREGTKNEIMEHAPSRTIINGTVDSQKVRAAWYKSSDVVCVPTYFEPFCMVALESLMLGVPTIISNIDAPKELFVDTGWAIGTLPGEASSIANGLNEVLSGNDDMELRTNPRVMDTIRKLGINPGSSSLRAQIAQRGVNKMYNIETVADMWLKKYEELLR